MSRPKAILLTLYLGALLIYVIGVGVGWATKDALWP